MQSEGDGAEWAAKYSVWEFTHCGICYLPFINPRNPQAPPPVPFWLTECSHVVCNNHLNADQTCRQCANGQHIELMPLQLDLPEPMSKWFQPIPDALLDLNGATKFQHETMASLIRFYKGKCIGQKELIERLRREVDSLKAEVSRMRQGIAAGDPRAEQGYDFINENGKRRRFDRVKQELFEFERDSRQGHSPQFLDPGYGTSRLTLRPGSSRLEQEGRSYLSNSSGDRPRKGGRSSPISLEEFAYQLPDHEAERGHTARASMGAFNAMGSNGAPALRSVGLTNNFSAGPSQPTMSSNTAIHTATCNERFKPPPPPPQMPVRRPDELSNQPSATRKRFHPVPPSTPIPNSHSTNPNLGLARMAPPLNLVRGSSTSTGSRRFVPPTPTRKSFNQPPPISAQQSRTQSQSQMPPPPPPGSSRFR